MGQVQQHSMALPTPPALRAIQVFFWAGGIFVCESLPTMR